MQEVAQEMLNKSEKDLLQNQIAFKFAQWQVESETDEERKTAKQEEANKLMLQSEQIEKAITLFKEFIPNL